MAKTNVVSIQTNDSGLPDIANMTPDQLAQRHREIQAILRENAAISKELEKRNAGRIAELEFQIFAYRALARPYMKLAKQAHEELRTYQPERVKVVFGKKGKLSDAYAHFVEKFKREVADFDDARLLADPEDMGVESVE